MAAVRQPVSVVQAQIIARAKPRTFVAQAMAHVPEASNAPASANASKQADNAAQTADTVKKGTSALSIVMVVMAAVQISNAQPMFPVV